MMKWNLLFKKIGFTLLTKITVIVIAFILLTYGVIVLLQGHHTKQITEDFLREMSSTVVTSLAYDAEYPVLIGNKEMLGVLLRGVFKQKWVISASVQDSEGNTLAAIGEPSREKSPSAAELENKPPVWFTRPDKRTLRSWALIRRSKNLFIPGELDTPSQGETSGEIIGLAMVGISTQRLMVDLKMSRWKAGLVTLAIATAGSAVLILIMRKTIISPLAILLEGTRKIQAGQLRHRVNIHSADEIGQLAGSFNSMAQSLQTHTENLFQLVDEKTRDIKKVNKELKDFVYTVSHDLKAPLRGIESFSQFLVEDYHDRLDEKAGEYLQEIHKSALRMKALIEDLLLLSRLTRIRNPYKTVPSGQIVLESMEYLHYAVEEKNVQIVVQPKLPSILCDEIKLKEVFKNLLSNAIKFSRELPPRIEIGASEDDNAYRFFVKDNGIGIEEKYLEKIFEVFQRLHAEDEYEGTGLGLHLARKIIEEHGGRLWAESTPGLGSTFYFTLPKEHKAYSEESAPQEGLHGATNE